MHYLYILLLSNEKLYTGTTDNLKRRFLEHTNGKVKSTKNFRPVKLIHYEGYILKSDALRREKFLKNTEGKRFLRQQIRDILERGFALSFDRAPCRMTGRVPPPPPIKIILLINKNMKGFVSNIEKDTLENDNFRKVLYTGKHSQLVLMCLKPKEEIGMEVHEDNDQFFRFEKGQGKVIIDGNEYEVSDGFAVVVPSGAQHNVINLSETEEMKVYTIYSPSHHKDGVVRKTKAEAEADSPEFDGGTTE